MEHTDYLVIGGGTAGCIVAGRLADLPEHPHVTLVEWGPDDAREPRAQSIRRWEEMVESEYAVQHQSVPQVRGNSNIDHTRLHILGGCSTANTMISWVPFRGDLQEWERRGADGWGPDAFLPYAGRLRTRISVIPEYDQNPRLARMVDTASTALGIERVTEWNDHDYRPGAGFFEIGYVPETNQRSSGSNAYRDLLTRAELRGNLTVLTGHRALRLVLDGDTVVGAVVAADDAAGADAGREPREIQASREVVLCAGAYETPKLLMLSGIGDPEVLDAAGVPVRVSLPGVGGNLQDHAEGIVVWEVTGPVEPQSATGWDAGYLFGDEHADDPEMSDLDPVPVVATHVPQVPWVEQLVRAGVPLPEHIAGVAPNVSRPHSRGRVWIDSNDPDDELQIDYGYFTDPEQHDEAALVLGVRNARRLAAEHPFADEVVREVFPGEHVQTDEEISAAERAVHQTVYHPCGTCRIGAADDPASVLDAELRVRGVQGLRVADASAFPTITSINPVITIMMLAERAVDLVAADLDADLEAELR
ncbi:GMC family oxidoreductase [Pseudoclavibacter sp. 13-3]|uniref:GMC family oxidoreductase n=1 Tax=Pseudoclavibacter sp. 13-3 TaxID=2901228 RepID=UPI001E44CA13|nr:GMC oxidoreductase [Pseudoclavibacter sp. 13-3]MCD7101248.1 FAD-dependent oxidoreductase [Pseudoclavibacter sp. 13-3]